MHFATFFESLRHTSIAAAVILSDAEVLFVALGTSLPELVTTITSLRSGHASLGVGNVIGTLFGVMTLATINSIVTTSGLRDPWWQEITVGAMLCFFILLQAIFAKIKERKK